MLGRTSGFVALRDTPRQPAPRPEDLKLSAAPLTEPQISRYTRYYSKHFHNAVMEYGCKIVVLPYSSRVGLSV